ncbi:UvrD-helicase domain-containing protein [Raineyella sp. LH-20]|uniref:UvrD-helicase domain-containing protein n=1 Tax=Raineyella sp. LH-20 TaxID=3081204 RepID=UPI0029557B5C|nr:UvrD-helicase domain-containing protein [Raineyella sp. LH-20]WOP17882.1 UvrD-helicase domain-containing protein [Raineyella sp. LH-20]
MPETPLLSPAPPSPGPAPVDSADRLDLAAPLPGGTTLLEASAGTGKTHTIASLVVLSVARGTPLRSILLITFTRKAARELRARVRSRLTEAVRVLDTPAAPNEDPLWQALRADASATTRDRLVEARTDFDAATIATIHEFAGSMLDRLGLLSGHRTGTALLADHHAITTEVADDLHLSMYGGLADPPFSPEVARTLVAAAMATPAAPIVPDPADDPAVAARVDFAGRARREVERRLISRGLYTYDDLIGRLAAALRQPATATATAARLREAYRVVMVDEFQDTDPRQWEILQTAFHGHSDLFLIGDPKQAIYGFRGGDVQTYLAAAQAADRRLTLTTNWRSDASVVRAVDAVLGGTALGDPDITLVPVRACHEGSRLHDPVGTPCPGMELRRLSRTYRSVSAQRERIRRDAVAVVTRLLTDGTTLDDGGSARPVRPRDIAVLVRTNIAAERMARALIGHGIPAVLNGADSVLRSPAATAWRDLLATLLDPQPAAVHRLALGPFVGWGLEDLIRAGEDERSVLFIRARTWARRWQECGVTAVLEAALDEGQLAAGSISRTGSEREITDLRHLGQLLHEAETDGHLAPRRLLAWLDDAMSAAGRSGDDDHSLRLETEAEAVQVLTVHSAKGLEFPIVLLPDMTDVRPAAKDEVVPEAFTVHDRAGDRMVDVGGRRDPSSRARHRIALDEAAGEQLRVLYVAMTRAASQVIAWWAPHEKNAPAAPLHRALFGERAVDGTLPRVVAALEDQAPPPLAEVRVAYVADDTEPLPPPTAPEPAPPLLLRRFDRPLDTAWRRTSYTGLTAAQHDRTPDAPLFDGVRADDEPALDGSSVPPSDTAVADAARAVAGRAVAGGAADATDPAAGRTSPWGLLPTGARFGTLVHAVLEAWDPSGTPFTRLVDGAVASSPVDGLDPAALAAALDAATRTPLGGELAATSLADVALGDRLSELDFELPLGGGDRPGEASLLADIADALDRHLPADDPLAGVGYPAHLRAPGLGDQTLRGFLTGSIDAVLRVGGATPRFVVVDYKTNWLGGPPSDGLLPLAAYAPGSLAGAMAAAHYPLQALLYTVALHRFLSWRLPGYRPEEHLGGIRYLFLRGMVGPGTPTAGDVPYGVFAWRPPAALVVEIADLITDGRPLP